MGPFFSVHFVVDRHSCFSFDWLCGVKLKIEAGRGQGEPGIPAKA